MNNLVHTEANDDTRHFSVNWTNHMNHVRTAFDTLLNTSELVDVTLYCEGQKTGAHKMMLSACSKYFREVFKEVPCEHPVIILKGVQFSVLQDILKFIYSGEVSIESQNFDAFLETAQFLKISGLTESSNTTSPAPTAAVQMKQDTQTAGKTIQPDHVPNSNENTNSSMVGRPQVKPKCSTSMSIHNTLKEPAVSLKREREPEVGNSSRNIDTSLTIKSEPLEKDYPQYIDTVDPLHDDIPENMDADDGDDSLLSLSKNIQEYKDDSIKFESVFVTSDPSANTVRHSAFSEASLKCTICNKIFSHPYSLHHHKAVHSGSTQCPICHAVLSRKYNLKIHMKARHNV